MRNPKGMAALVIAGGVMLWAFAGKRKTPSRGRPGRRPGPRVGPKPSRSTPIGKAAINGVPILDGYPHRPGAVAGRNSFIYDWAGKSAAATNDPTAPNRPIRFWLPHLKKVVRNSPADNAFRIRTEALLVLIDAYLAS